MSDNPAEYHKGLAERIKRREPFVYPCRKSTKKIKFYSPTQLKDAENSVIILGIIERAQYDQIGASVRTLEALKAWVGEEGYQTIVKEDGLNLEEIGQVFMDAVTHFQEDTGTPGES